MIRGSAALSASTPRPRHRGPNAGPQGRPGADDAPQRHDENPERHAGRSQGRNEGRTTGPLGTPGRRDGRGLPAARVRPGRRSPGDHRTARGTAPGSRPSCWNRLPGPRMNGEGADALRSDGLRNRRPPWNWVGSGRAGPPGSRGCGSGSTPTS